MKGIKAGMIITYDVNGNMIKDLNKIGSIAYNHLNLPVVVHVTSNKGNTISYIYDATGVKLKKTAPGNMVT